MMIFGMKTGFGALLLASAASVTTAQAQGQGQNAAQTAPAQQEPADIATGNSGDIIVTAQKREERLQDVPISVSVISAAQLDAFKLNEATDLQYVVPGLTLVSGASSRSFGFFVRGIGTSSFSSESIEGSTAVVLDGVVIGQTAASLTDLPDIERVEVLKGPQGTLFGKNSSAGVVNITTRNPSKELTGKLSGSWAWPDNDRRIGAYISGPIGEDVGFALSARLNKRDGYVTNVYDGRKLNDRNEWGVRGKLKLDPTSRLSLMLIGDYYKRDADCCIWTLRTGLVSGGVVPSRDNLKQNIGGALFSDSASYGASLQADYDLGGGYNLTSISAWRRFTNFDNNDADSSPFNLLDVNNADFRQRQLTQEIRLTSPKGGTVDYVLGGYFFDSKVTSRSTQLIPPYPFPFYSKIVDNRAQTRNVAAFGQANIHVTPALQLIAGARVLNERATAIKDRRDPVLGLTSHADAEKSDTALLWRGGLQYDFSKDLMVFGTISRGYKGGGYDTNIGLPNLPDVRPERPISLETGFRGVFPKARLTFNFTAYYTRVDDYQAAARDPGPPPVTQIFNGEAKTRGFEADFAWRPVAGADWSLYGSAAYVDGRWGNFRNAPCYSGQIAATGCVAGQQDLTDARLPFSSRWSGTIATSYAVPVGALKLSADLSLSWRSSALIAFPNDPATLQKGYALVNGSVALASGETWKVSLFGKNLTDKRYSVVDFTTPLGATGSYSQFIPYEAQRVIGLSLDVGF
jgi:iron complex outermembrane receptor protein